jgi:hypothetical protein
LYPEYSGEAKKQLKELKAMGEEISKLKKERDPVI